MKFLRTKLDSKVQNGFTTLRQNISFTFVLALSLRDASCLQGLVLAITIFCFSLISFDSFVHKLFAVWKLFWLKVFVLPQSPFDTGPRLILKLFRVDLNYFSYYDANFLRGDSLLHTFGKLIELKYN